MINLQSQIAGQQSGKLLPGAKGEAMTGNAEKQNGGGSFLRLMTEFLGLKVDQETSEKPDTKLQTTGFNSFKDLKGKRKGEINLELISPKEKLQADLVNLQEGVQTEELPDELLIQLSNVIQMAGVQDQLKMTPQKTGTNSVRFTQEGGDQLKNTGSIESSLKVLNQLLDGLQIRRSGENIVLSNPGSSTELTAEKKENIQKQLVKIVRQLSGQSDQGDAKTLSSGNTDRDLKNFISSKTDKADVRPPSGNHSEQVKSTSKETSASTQPSITKSTEFIKAGDAQQGKALENVPDGNQKSNTQQNNTLSLKEVTRLLSEEVEMKTEKTTQPQDGSQRLSSESKDPALFSDNKNKSDLSPGKQNSQADRKLQTDAELLKSNTDEILKKDGESLSRKFDIQNSKNSSPVRLVDKSQSKPIQISSLSEIKQDESAFKPLVKIETQNGGVELDLQSQADTESGDSEEGKSFLKLNNTGINQLTKSSGRRDFSSQIAKQLQKQADQTGFGTAKNWNQHRFVLENGDSVNVAVRQSEGVMQLQLGSGNSELNRILIQNINEIREHLQEQMNLDIDLQLQDFGGQQTDLNDNGNNPGNGKQDTNNGTGMLRQQAETEAGGSNNRARYLGFNQNEWTA